MENKTVVGLTMTDKLILIIVTPIVGALLGWFIKIIASWLLKIPFIPFEPLWEWVVAWDSVWVPVIGAVVGIIAGVLFVFYAFSVILKMTITDQDVTLVYNDKEEKLQKKDISAIFLDGKEIVFLGNHGQELYRRETDNKKQAIAEAFQQHFFPWKDEDPYANQYHRWVPDHPDFPAAVNTLLAARERVIQEGNEKEIDILRRDLAAEGVVIRDQDGHQYVRLARGKHQ